MNNILALDILKQLKDEYVSRTGLIDSETTYPALICGIKSLEKLEKLENWLVKSEDEFKLLRISIKDDKLKCWYLSGQLKILEEVRDLL